MILPRSQFPLSLLPALLLAGSAVAADPGPLRETMFVRGAFNGWNADAALVHQGGGVYSAELLVGPGNHGFKLGTRDWGREWVPAAGAASSVALDQRLLLATQPGPQATLLVRSTASYRFTLDASNPAAPTLAVTRLAGVDASATPDPHMGQAALSTLRFATHDGGQEVARFSLLPAPAPDQAARRSYTHSTTLALRDPLPAHTSYAEPAGLPYLRSSSLAFDALFALAASELRTNAVSEIRDGNYAAGAPIACDCFETGAQWHYVWTRDLSYAADLGLAMLDPLRVRNSLLFKTAPLRAGAPAPMPAPMPAPAADGASVAGAQPVQIVQDTGSGGSWPVSTDRVSWAFAAEQTLRWLPPAARPAFAAQALAALVNTVENDRLAAFDAAAGLYTGEQSFLDWREQSYASWIVHDLAAMASARSLSTNAAHYQALRLTARLARETGDTRRAARYTAWAAQLKRAVNARFWLPDMGMYSSLTAGHFDQAALYKFDWLGQALAVTTGLASARQARSILAHYPHGPLGAPVIWPQQRDAPVYHNRALWPFVTGYGLRAAARTGNAQVADAAVASLVRGAALNLSNMENLEWLSGQPLLIDEAQPALTGPVINSRRQLWSVGAYLGMVIDTVFGVAGTDAGLLLRPFVTSQMRRTWFGAGTTATLHELTLRGARITVRLVLPPASAQDGVHPVLAVRRNGLPASRLTPWKLLRDGDTFDVVLGAVQAAAAPALLRRVQGDPYQAPATLFAPREPELTALARDASGHAVLRIAAQASEAPIRYHVYRDGKRVAANLAAGAWRDPERRPFACYALEAQYGSTGNRSHHSAPACVGPASEIGVADARVATGTAVAHSSSGQPYLAAWGAPGDRFVLADLRIATAGTYALQLRYRNEANQINLGISNGVKWVSVEDASGRALAQGVLQMPHTLPASAPTAPLPLSTPLVVKLRAGAYRVRLSDFYNMSYLESNASFTGAGGPGGPANRVDLYGLRLLRLR